MGIQIPSLSNHLIACFHWFQALTTCKQGRALVLISVGKDLYQFLESSKAFDGN